MKVALVARVKQPDLLAGPALPAGNQPDFLLVLISASRNRRWQSQQGFSGQQFYQRDPPQARRFSPLCPPGLHGSTLSDRGFSQMASLG